MEEITKTFTVYLGAIVEGAAALLIAHAVMQAGIRYGRAAFQKSQDKMQIRLDLGSTLAVALEFLLAADILRTAVAPTWEEIGKLSAIAALRTLLNYFLERELKKAELKIQTKP